MTKEQLLQKLKQNDNLLPHEILQDTTLLELARQLKSIFEDNRDELEEDAKLRANFTELVNYVYIATLSKKPDQRNKNIFSVQLTNFLLSQPHPA